MAGNVASLIWQIPVTVLVSIAASVIVVWAISGALGMQPSYSTVAAISGVLSAVAIAIEVARETEENESLT